MHRSVHLHQDDTAAHADHHVRSSASCVSLVPAALPLQSNHVQLQEWTSCKQVQTADTVLQEVSLQLIREALVNRTAWPLLNFNMVLLPYLVCNDERLLIGLERSSRSALHVLQLSRCGAQVRCRLQA
jgi:hypothetical protein